jgi:hypothetical protein
MHINTLDTYFFLEGLFITRWQNFPQIDYQDCSPFFQDTKFLPEYLENARKFKLLENT